MYSRIILVGFPGSGKSTIAKKIANRLNFHVVDLDHLFESKYKLSIPEFFKKYGEEKVEYIFRIEPEQLFR